MAGGCVSKKAAKVTLGISISILIISVVMAVSFESIYNAVLKKYISLGEGSLVTKIWEDIPLPIYEKLYFFNITNKKAFLKGKEPLNVIEVGPYTYKSRWIKNDTHWNSNNTVSYRETRTYHFVPELSNGTEDDSIYTLNGPVVIGANIVPSLMRFAFDVYCRVQGETAITRKTIRQLAYEGYSDDIIKYSKDIIPDAPYKDGLFSWLYGKNDSNDGLFTVFTGTDDETKTNFINNWNGKEKLSFWKNDSCNMLSGTSIETGPPIKRHLESYTFFQSIFCRSLTFKYAQDVKHFDILAKRFRPTYDLLANSTENPDNHCFEVNEEHASGVLDVSSCQFDAPVLISFPHFHLADPSYLNVINGLAPEDEKHGSYIDVEPITGLSIDLTVRFQINLEIKKLSGFYFYKDITPGVYPVFWTELSLKIDEDLASFLKHEVREPKIIAYSVLGVLFLMGLTGTVISTFVLCQPKTEEEGEYLISSKDNFHPKSKYYSSIRNEEINVAEKEKVAENDKYSSSALSINDSSSLEKKNPNESAVVQVDAPEHT